MKLVIVMVLASAAVLAASCAHPLERVADARHQARMDEANAHQPLVNGAADGLGGYIARNREELGQHAAANP